MISVGVAYFVGLIRTRQAEAAFASSAPGQVLLARVIVAQERERARATASTSGPASAPGAAGHRGEIEICGLGFVADTEASQRAFFERQRDFPKDATQRMHAALLADPDPEVKAIGLVSAVFDAWASARPGTEAIPDSCDADEACLARAKAAQAPPKTSVVNAYDALVRQAIDTRSPYIYGLAVHLCGVGTDATKIGSCVSISARQWAELEPHNMVPWLFMASEADARHDAAGLDEAMYRASLAISYRGQASGMAARADASLAGRFNPLERWLEAIEVIGIEAASTSHVTRVARYCAAENVVDSNRRQVCERLTQALLDHGPGFMERGIALKVQRKQLGFAPERLATAQRENDLFQLANVLGAMAQDLESSDEALSCDVLTKQVAVATRTDRIGAIAEARRQLAESGKTMEAFAADVAAMRARLNEAWKKRAAEDVSDPAVGSPGAPSTQYSAIPPPAR